MKLVNLMLLDQMLASRTGPDIASCVAKVVVAGQQAGFTIEEMIEFLQNGLKLETLIDLIAARLEIKMLLGQVSNVNPPSS